MAATRRAAGNGTLAEVFKAEDDDTAITLTQDDVNRLSALVGRNILTRDDLISQVAFLTCVTVDGVQIPLEPGLLSRLKSRCYRTPFPDFLRQTVVKQLHDFAGW